MNITFTEAFRSIYQDLKVYTFFINVTQFSTIENFIYFIYDYNFRGEYNHLPLSYEVFYQNGLNQIFDFGLSTLYKAQSIQLILTEQYGVNFNDKRSRST